jgi:hypothetical protein
MVMAGSAVAAALLLLPVTPLILRSMTVVFVGTTEEYVLDSDEAAELVAALRGVEVADLPGPAIAVYDMELGLRGLARRSYQVVVTESRDIYLKQPLRNGLVHVDNPSFFYRHRAFRTLYEFREMPIVRIRAQGKEVIPQISRREWHILKWDNLWYEGELLSIPDQAEVFPKLVSRDDGLALQVEIEPDEYSLHVTDSAGGTVFDGVLPDGNLPTFWRNDTYSYRLDLSWNDSAEPFRGSFSAAFEVTVELPPSFELPGPAIVQGEMAVFYARHIPKGATPVLQTDIVQRVQLFPYEDGYVAYLPTHFGTIPREYRLTYGLAGQPLKEATLAVLSREFHVQHLRVDPGTVASTRNQAAYDQYALYFPQSRENSAEDRYYTESFILPVAGRLTTEFGQIRYVNNATSPSRHSGLDIAAPTGTVIVATNRGRVTLAMNLILTGNTLVIDHGQGLFSVHFHMNELIVEKGQLVERGEIVGTVGSTGFSTGPHLHFTMSYYTHNLEPGYFLVGEPITFTNAPTHLRPR